MKPGAFNYWVSNKISTCTDRPTVLMMRSLRMSLMATVTYSQTVAREQAGGSEDTHKIAVVQVERSIVLLCVSFFSGVKT